MVSVHPRTTRMVVARRMVVAAKFRGSLAEIPPRPRVDVVGWQLVGRHRGRRARAIDVP